MNPTVELSPLQLFRSLPEEDQKRLLDGIGKRERAFLAYRWQGWIARPSQIAPDWNWRIWLVMAGRGYGKTRVGAEWARASVAQHRYVNLIGATADDARDIMIEGESGILAVCPRWERPEYHPSKRRLDWPNGSCSLIFTADEPERLRGKQHSRIWADEIASWKYPESWDQALLGLRIGTDPRVVATTTPRPTGLIRSLVCDPTCAVTRGRTYDNLDNLAAPFAREIIRRYEGTRLGRQELEGELLEDEGLAYRFREQVHVVPRFELPPQWTRFECMDFGSSNPTAWLLLAVDYDGNLIVADEYYSPGLPSAHAEAVKVRRAWWQGRDESGRLVGNYVFADPSTFHGRSVTNQWGREATVADEFAECGVPLVRGNNDRRAGYVRIAELLRVEPDRAVPHWLAREMKGAPRLYVFEHCANVIEQLANAPLESPDKPLSGEAIDRDWEGEHGHAHAALRYGTLSRPAPSTEPEPPPDDPRAELMRKVEARAEEPDGHGRYVLV